MAHRSSVAIKRILTALGFGILLSPLLLYYRLSVLRPPQTNTNQTLFQGIVYQRIARVAPRPMMIHIVTLDLSAPGVRSLVTPGNATADDTEVTAQTTTEFVEEFGLQLAINASYFNPFYERTPWNYYPVTGDRVNVLGQAISNAQSYSPSEPGWETFCLLGTQGGTQRAVIANQGVCPAGTTQAVAGRGQLIAQGKPIELTMKPGTDNPYPRTAVGIDRIGTTLWFVLVDGKQPLYSEGMTLAELQQMMIQLGAETALNLDGGGSTTLAIATPEGARLLNAPIHTKIPMRQRSIGTQIGFYALPVQQP